MTAYRLCPRCKGAGTIETESLDGRPIDEGCVACDMSGWVEDVEEGAA